MESTEIELVYRSHQRDAVIVPSSWVQYRDTGVAVITGHGHTIDDEDGARIEEFFPWESVKSIRRHRLEQSAVSVGHRTV